jgi:thioredoxin reductase
VRFAERTGVRERYGTRWEGTSREGATFVLHTNDGEYRTRYPVFAVGVAEPYLPDTPGIELTSHYVATREAPTYAGKRLFIVGKQNSGFELASGLAQWADGIILASPRPAQLSVNTHSLAGIRARYVQPWEDANLGGGVAILNASIERYEGLPGGRIRVHTRRSDSGEAFSTDVDEVIAATGFTCPLQDLPALGVATFGQSRLPMMTNHYESATLPGIFFAGTIGQGVPGLKKYGHPANSGAVHGARYNLRLMIETLGARHLGVPRPRPALDPAGVVAYLLDELTDAPELWHQKSYLARAVSRDPDGTLRDDGIVSLAAFVDASGPDAVAVTVETDATGDIHPAVYVRRHGRVDGDRCLPGAPLHDYRTPDHRAQLAELLGDLAR